MVCAVNRLPIISGYVTARRPRSDMEKPDILVDGGLEFYEGKCFDLISGTSTFTQDQGTTVDREFWRNFLRF